MLYEGFAATPGRFGEVNIRLTRQAVANVSYVTRFEQHVVWQLTLHTQTVLLDIGGFEIGIDSGDGALNRAGVRCAGAERCQVTVVEFCI